MKTSKFINELQKLKRKHGDLEIAFDETSVNPEAEIEYCIRLIEPVGAFKIPWNESNRNKSLIVLAATQLESKHKLSSAPARALKGGK